MKHGFTAEHFALLAEYDGKVRQVGNADEDRDYAELVAAYEATANWARAVQRRLFPQGYVRKLSKPTDQWHQKFKPYTWTRIYPRREAPRHLAYTVGIEAAGEFCVKIDTVGVNDRIRKRYEALCRYDHHLSPFASMIPAEKGLAMSFEELLDWSNESIATFEPGYDEIARRLGLMSPNMRLITDMEVSRNAFDLWRDILLDNADGTGPVRSIAGHGVWFREKNGKGGAEVQAGLDPFGKEWAVEFNAPPEPGDYQRLTAIAADETGGLHLLRQGWLRGRRPAHDIRISEFIASTGLSPVPVEAEGKAAERRWFLVADLGDSPERIRKKTADFIELCWAARTPIEPTDTAASEAGESLGGDESDAPYLLPARGAMDSKTIDQLHGTVWKALAASLSTEKINYRKWRRADGYSIDMEIAREGEQSLLVEIKTGCAASDVHTGVGQLSLYRKLFPRLAGHKAVLLIDVDLPKGLAYAVAALDIEVHHYAWYDENGTRRVKFSDNFRALCGFV